MKVIRAAKRRIYSPARRPHVAAVTPLVLCYLVYERRQRALTGAFCSILDTRQELQLHFNRAAREMQRQIIGDWLRDTLPSLRKRG